MADIVKDCPHCGAKAEVVGYPEKYAVTYIYPSCKCLDEDYEDSGFRLDNWNKRVEEEKGTVPCLEMFVGDPLFTLVYNMIRKESEEEGKWTQEHEKTYAGLFLLHEKSRKDA